MSTAQQAKSSENQAAINKAIVDMTVSLVRASSASAEAEFVARCSLCQLQSHGAELLLHFSNRLYWRPVWQFMLDLWISLAVRISAMRCLRDVLHECIMGDAPVRSNRPIWLFMQMAFFANGVC